MATLKLTDMCVFERGLTYAKSDEVSFSKNVVLRANNIDLVTHELNFDDLKYINDEISIKPSKILKKDSILICTASGSKSHLGKVAYVHEDAGYAFGGFMGQLTAKEGVVLPKYLFFLLISPKFKRHLNNLSDGTNINNLKFSDISDFECEVPSLDEQSAIVERLSSVSQMVHFEGVALQNEQALARELAQMILADNLGRIEGSEVVALKEIAELRGRIGWKGLTAKEYVKEGPRFLSVHSLNYGHYVDFQDAFNITQARYDESPEIMLQKNDILICKDGAGIGKLGMVPELLGPTTINSSMLLIRATDRVFHEYLYFYLLSPMFQRIVQERLSGSTTPHLYQRDIAELSVVLPSLDVQRELVSKIWRAFELQEEVSRIATEKRNLFEILKNTFLTKYLSGVNLAA
jgi:type I restriction enzyme S subunit